MDLFKGLTPKEYVDKTYIKKGSTRDYKQFCLDLVQEIGGKDNYISCSKSPVPFTSPIRGTQYIMKLKNPTKAEFIDRLICSECFIHNTGEHIEITADGLMQELIDALCTVTNE